MGLAIDTSGSRASKVLFLAFRMRYEVAGTKEEEIAGLSSFYVGGKEGLDAPLGPEGDESVEPIVSGQFSGRYWFCRGDSG